MTARATLDELAKYGVATVYEASGRQGLVDESFIQVIPGSKVAGPAVTVRCGQGDNLMVHAAMDNIQPGDILVLTMPQPDPTALVGELLATQALVHKAAGILIDGAVRDVDELRDLGLPIWTRFVRVRGATKTKIGTINEPVVVGGTIIHPGDIVILDADGAVVVQPDRADEVVQSSSARIEREDRLRTEFQKGSLSYDLHGLRAVVEGEGHADEAPYNKQ